MTEPADQEPAADINEVEDVERQIWEDFRNGRFDSMEARAAEGFVFVGPQGVADRATWRTNIAQQVCEIESILLEDVAVSALAPTVALMTYRMVPDGACNGAAMEPGVASTTFVWEADSWKVASHHWSPLPQ